MRSLYDKYRQAAERNPAARLLFSTAAGVEQITLDAVCRRGTKVGRNLVRAGLGEGTVLVTQMTNCPELAICYVATAYAGAIMLALPPTLGEREARFIFREAPIQILVSQPEIRGRSLIKWLKADTEFAGVPRYLTGADSQPHFSPWHNLEVNDCDGSSAPEGGTEAIDLLIYTSGTTGDPKGVCHNGAVIEEKVALIREREKPGRRVGGVHFAAWQSGTVATTSMYMRALLYGEEIGLMDFWDPDRAVAFCEAYDVDYGEGVPVHLRDMIEAARKHGKTLSGLDLFAAGGAPVPPPLVADADQFNIKVIRAYGSTENPGSTYGSSSDSLEKRLTTEGRPLPGTEMRFIDDDGNDMPPGEPGEIITRGTGRFLGYRNPALNEAALLPGGWYRTGDIGNFDADGYLIVSDRKKEIVIRGGENISSIQIENALLTMPGVLDAAVVAAPDDRLGEVVCAVLVVETPVTMNLDLIRSHFASLGLSYRKTPEKMLIVDKLPRSEMGKVLKREIAKLVERSAREPERP